MLTNRQVSLDGSVIRRLQIQTAPGRQHSFMEIDHEIFSTVIFSLYLIQKFLAKECAQSWLTYLED